MQKKSKHYNSNKQTLGLFQKYRLHTRVCNVVGGFRIFMNKIHGQPGMAGFGQNNVLIEHIVFPLKGNVVLHQGFVQGVGPQERIVVQPKVICKAQFFFN